MVWLKKAAASSGVKRRSAALISSNYPRTLRRGRGTMFGRS